MDMRQRREVVKNLSAVTSDMVGLAALNQSFRGSYAHFHWYLHFSRKFATSGGSETPAIETHSNLVIRNVWRIPYQLSRRT